MALINEDSKECLNSELDLFEIPPTQTSIGDSFYINYFPITSLDRGGPIEFIIKTGDDVYLDLENTILYTKSRILKRDGTAIAKTTEADAKPATLVCPINLFHSTMFRNIEVFINGRLASTNDNLSAYRAYMETLLTYSKEAKTDQLRCALFYEDDGEDLDWIDDEIDADDEADASNCGLYRRFQRTKYSRYFETWGRIHSELFTQSKMLPGGNEVRIKFHRNDPAFCLMSKSNDGSYLISAEEVVLKVRHCEVAAHIRESHAKALATRKMKFPITKVEMKFFSHGSGRNDLTENNLCSGILPSRVVIGLVRSDAFNGTLNKNPFNFQHFGVQSIVLRKNGAPMPFEEIELDYDNDCYYQGYLSLVASTGKLYQDQGFALPPDQYPHGYALYAFSLTDSSKCGTLDLIQEGKLSLEIKLKSPTTHSVTTVVYLEYNTILELDNEGNIYSNE